MMAEVSFQCEFSLWRLWLWYKSIDRTAKIVVCVKCIRSGKISSRGFSWQVVFVWVTAAVIMNEKIPQLCLTFTTSPMHAGLPTQNNCVRFQCNRRKTNKAEIVEPKSVPNPKIPRSWIPSKIPGILHLPRGFCTFLNSWLGIFN